MRDIRFRAWMIDYKRWQYFDFDDLESMAIHWRDNGLAENEVWIYQQYTGLKDKNGTEIYEGDIVEYIGHKNRIISWTPDDNHYAGWYAIKEGSMPLPVSEGNENNTIEVIGNIYENPTLTEKMGQSTKECASSEAQTKEGKE